MHVYIINWRVVHRQYLFNTYSLHVISLLFETSVPVVHETMDTVSEESLGLRAKPFFNGFSDLIVVCEPASLQCLFFSGPNTWKSQSSTAGNNGAPTSDRPNRERLKKRWHLLCIIVGETVSVTETTNLKLQLRENHRYLFLDCYEAYQYTV